MTLRAIWPILFELPFHVLRGNLYRNKQLMFSVALLTPVMTWAPSWLVYQAADS